MSNVFYITSYNDPASCEKCMQDMADVPMDGWQRILSDQSSDEFIPHYMELCEKYGYKYVHHDNGGAQQTKHEIIRHAQKEGFHFMAQISEDFELTVPEKANGRVPIGSQGFFQDAYKLLVTRPNLSFVNWTFVREDNGYGYVWGSTPPRMNLRNAPDVSLMWMDGDVCLFNWPYTGRVSSIGELLFQATVMKPNSEEHMAKVSLGHGACLLAQPVRHTGRKKPEGSIA